jgi:hypothetical protein
MVGQISSVPHARQDGCLSLITLWREKANPGIYDYYFLSKTQKRSLVGASSRFTRFADAAAQRGEHLYAPG